MDAPPELDLHDFQEATKETQENTLMESQIAIAAYYLHDTKACETGLQRAFACLRKHKLLNMVNWLLLTQLNTIHYMCMVAARLESEKSNPQPIVDVDPNCRMRRETIFGILQSCLAKFKADNLKSMDDFNKATALLQQKELTTYLPWLQHGGAITMHGAQLCQRRDEVNV